MASFFIGRLQGFRVRGLGFWIYRSRVCQDFREIYHRLRHGFGSFVVRLQGFRVKGL